MLKNIATVVFLTRLKSFSISCIIPRVFSFLFIISLAIPLITSGCITTNSRNTKRPYPYEQSTGNNNSVQNSRPTPFVSVKAPWEVWEITDFGNEKMRAGNRFIKEGKLDEALSEYQTAIGFARTSEEAENAILQVCSTHLKMGHGKDALSSITKYAIKRKVDASQLDAKFSLITAYSYVQTNDITQGLAWFAQAYRSGAENGKVALEARRASRQLVRTQSDNAIIELNSKWSDDSFVSPIISEEKERRLRGGSPLSFNSFSEYFEKNKYQAPITPIAISNQAPIDASQRENQEIINPDSNSSISDLSFGALLPLSGTYAQYAEKVSRGIQLALEELGVKTPLIEVNTADIGATVGYQNLVQQRHVKSVFGPLLVKDAEEVASLSASLRVPCITFAKKRGLPESSVGLYRLGVTAENQLSEAFRFASSIKNVSEILLFLPDDELGAEFKDAATSYNNKYGATKFIIIVYSTKSFESVDAAINQALSNNPAAVMVVDTPTRIESLLNALKQKLDYHSIPIFGSAITGDTKYLMQNQNLFEGLYLTSFFNPGSRQYVVTKFVDDYKNKFNEAPDLLAAQSYDAAKYVLTSFRSYMERNKNLNLSGKEIEALDSAKNYTGVTGDISMLPSGEMQRTIRITQVKNGSLVDAE